MHDFEHRGVNNDFLVRTADPLAILYNDRSPMENHHLAAAFQLLSCDEFNFLKRLPHKTRVSRAPSTQLKRSDMAVYRGVCRSLRNRGADADADADADASYTNSSMRVHPTHAPGNDIMLPPLPLLPPQESLRKLVIDMVLATDMKQHFAITGNFTSKLNHNISNSARTSGAGAGPAASAAKSRTVSSHQARHTEDDAVRKPPDEENRSLTLQVGWEWQCVYDCEGSIDSAGV